MASDLRTHILDTLRTNGRQSLDDIREYVAQKTGLQDKDLRRSVGQSMRHLQEAGKVNPVGGGRFALVNGTAEIAQANPEAEKVTLAPFQARRSGRTVSLEHSPLEISDVARVELKALGRYYPIPMFGDIRICIGKDIPKWSPDQETYDQINAIRVTTKDGRVTEMNHNVADPITIAPLG